MKTIFALLFLSLSVAALASISCSPSVEEVAENDINNVVATTTRERAFTRCLPLWDDFEIDNWEFERTHFGKCLSNMETLTGLTASEWRWLIFDVEMCIARGDCQTLTHIYSVLNNN